MEHTDWVFIHGVDFILGSRELIWGVGTHGLWLSLITKRVLTWDEPGNRTFFWGSIQSGLNLFHPVPRRVDGGLDVISDNKEYPMQIVEKTGINVLGKVVSSIGKVF